MSAPPLPPNWTDFVLDDWTTVHNQGAFAGTIHWTEVVDKMSLNRLRLSGEQASAGELVFAASFDFSDPDAMLTLAVSILGGYSEDDDTMYAPMAHPQYPYLRATDVEMHFGFLDNTQANESGELAHYRVMLCKVSFQSLPYDVDAAIVEDVNPNWQEWQADATNDRLTLPCGFYIFKSGDGNPSGDVSAQLGQVFTAGTSYLTLIVHRVPDTTVLADSSTGVCVLQPDCGKVNSDTFNGCAPGTLLLDSVQTIPFGDFQNRNIYDVKINFIYHPQGWNKSLDSDGNWYDIGFKDDPSMPPFASTSFVTMVQSLIP